MAVKIFICYVHEDESLLKKLKTHLRLLQRQGQIGLWHDHDISAGMEWEQEISQHLNEADIILLLISADFLASDYCYSIELKRAIERHERGEARVIPIILRHVNWQSAPFGRLQALPRDGKPVIDPSWHNRDKALYNVAEGIRKVVEELKAVQSSTESKESTSQSYDSNIYQNIPPCPYRWLSPFREQDAPFFFGRETFAEQLMEQVRRKSFVAVIGPSGSGKSSVVFAGVLPQLRHDGNWLIASFRPSVNPFHALASTLTSLLEPNMGEIDRLVEANKLAKGLEVGEILLHNVLVRILEKKDVAHIILVADQFEELYTLCRDAEKRERFIDQFLTVVQAQSSHNPPSFHFLITLRADFVGYALSYRPFADALQHSDLKLGPMNHQELQDAIQKPSQQLLVQFETGLIERILNQVGHQSGNLPLIEFTLSLLWERQQNSRLTHAAYDEIGGVEQALTTYADKVYGDLSLEEKKLAQQVFVQLVQPGEGTEDTRRLATCTEVGKESWDLVVRLSHTRLVVCAWDEARGEETVELVHEALIKGWRCLRDWMKTDHEFRIWQERLRHALRQWEDNNQDEWSLLQGNILIESEAWLKLRPNAISAAEQAFISASRTQQVTKIKLVQSFISTIRHDIQTPLVTIKAAVTGLLHNEAHWDDQIRDEILEDVNIATDHLSLLINNFIEVSRIEMGAVVLNKKSFNIVELVNNTISSMERVLAGRKVHTNFQPQPLAIQADDVQLERVFRNLLDNAVKHSPEQSEILITLELENGMLRAQVINQGSSVPESERERIFKPFYSFNETGSGFGLAICRGIVEAHGGHIWVEPVLKEGRAAMNFDHNNAELPPNPFTALGDDKRQKQVGTSFVFVLPLQ